VLLVHPGGPFWRGKDAGAWTIPKGEIGENEDPLDAARREFREETGLEAPREAIALTPLTQPSRKVVHAWAAEGDCDAAGVRSNLFEMEWPPHSGKTASFPEIDAAAWFDLPEARQRILRGQALFLDELERLVNRSS
jgi:predicted NUDIX family NTP pyrophosphohydrolase